MPLSLAAACATFQPLARKKRCTSVAGPKCECRLCFKLAGECAWEVCACPKTKKLAGNLEVQVRSWQKDQLAAVCVCLCRQAVPSDSEVTQVHLYGVVRAEVLVGQCDLSASCFSQQFHFRLLVGDTHLSRGMKLTRLGARPPGSDREGNPPKQATLYASPNSFVKGPAMAYTLYFRQLLRIA